MSLLFTLAYIHIFWLGAPYPATYHSIILLVFLMNTGLSWNSFGLDEPSEINRYLLFPLRGRDILLGKNLGFVAIVAVQLSVMAPEDQSIYYNAANCWELYPGRLYASRPPFIGR